ncbi:MAG: RNA methyltransferase [Acholeplasmatales bacterium]|nr:RNA methyltransferase [Acholeplasmatales bacterium]
MITSVQNAKIKELEKLNNARTRGETGLFLVEGPHLVTEARNLGLLVEAYSLEDKDGYTQVSDNVMRKICNTKTPVSEVGVVKIPSNKGLSDKVLILDTIQDPGNMGTIMRSARAFDFKTIILSDGCVDIYNDKVIRSSQGAIFKLNFIKGNLLDIIPTLEGYDVYGTDVVNGISIKEVNKNKKIAVVMGNEGNGVSKEVRNILKKNIYIPLNETESLNVGVAASIIMYELNK